MNAQQPPQQEPWGVDFTIENGHHHRSIIATITNHLDACIMFTRDKVDASVECIDFHFFDQTGNRVIPSLRERSQAPRCGGTRGVGINPGMTIRTGCPLHTWSGKYDFPPGLYRVIGVLTFRHRHGYAKKDWASEDREKFRFCSNWFDRETGKSMFSCAYEGRHFAIVSNMIEIEHLGNDPIPQDPKADNSFSPYFRTF